MRRGTRSYRAPLFLSEVPPAKQRLSGGDPYESVGLDDFASRAAEHAKPWRRGPFFAPLPADPTQTRPLMRGRPMGKNARPKMLKRQREKTLQERQQQKNARRLEAKERKSSAPRKTGDEDPDIAGIVPGPQRLPPQFDSDPEE